MQKQFTDEQLHLRYFEQCVKLLPSEYTSFDTSSLTLVYFALSGLDLLGELRNVLGHDDLSKKTIDWIYSLQVQNHHKLFGFLPSNNCKVKSNSVAQSNLDEEVYLMLNQGHLAGTYTALLSLLLLGDDLSRVKVEQVRSALGLLQQENGSFVPYIGTSESDMRFVYCACAIAFMLDVFDAFDTNKLISYILDSQSYDGGFGQGPLLESHGGSTYCALASLALLPDKLKADYAEKIRIAKKKALNWCLKRQVDGFQGRVNKNTDTCYAFWIGASLQILDGVKYIDEERLCEFLSRTKTKYGGYGKEPGDVPGKALVDYPKFLDVLHSYMGLAGLSLLGKGKLKLNGALNVSSHIFESLEVLKQKRTS